MRRGNRLFCSLDDFAAKVRHAALIDRRELYALWEQEQLVKMFAFCGVDCVFDVGANEGQYATMLRRKLGYRGWIASFEPIPAMAARLRERASLDPRWLVFECAVAESAGTRTFNVMRHSQFSSLAEPRHDDVRAFVGRNEAIRRIDVEARTLADVFPEVQKRTGCRAPFLKMDTQGFDLTIV